jgi:hypothetical protein
MAVKAAKNRRGSTLITVHGLIAHRDRLVNVMQKGFIDQSGFGVFAIRRG